MPKEDDGSKSKGVAFIEFLKREVCHMLAPRLHALPHHETLGM